MTWWQAYSFPLTPGGSDTAQPAPQIIVMWCQELWGSTDLSCRVTDSIVKHPAVCVSPVFRRPIFNEQQVCIFQTGFIVRLWERHWRQNWVDAWSKMTLIHRGRYRELGRLYDVRCEPREALCGSKLDGVSLKDFLSAQHSDEKLWAVLGNLSSSVITHVTDQWFLWEEVWWQSPFSSTLLPPSAGATKKAASEKILSLLARLFPGKSCFYSYQRCPLAKKFWVYSDLLSF